MEVADYLKKDILKEIKYTQMGDKVIITHKTFSPKQITLMNGSFELTDFKMLNVPYVMFSNANKYTLTSAPNVMFSYLAGLGKIATNTDFFNNANLLKVGNISFAGENLVGNYIDGGDKYKGRFKIESYISPREILVKEIIPFNTEIKDLYLSTNGLSIVLGYEKLYSKSRGYPSCCCFYQHRLWLNGAPEKENILIASRLDYYNDFHLDDNDSSDGIMLTLSASDYENIIEIIGNNGLQIFCGNSEWMIDDNNLTPNNVFVRRVSNIGINPLIKPIVVVANTYFVDKNNKSLNSFSYMSGGNSDSNKTSNLTSNNVTKFNQHMINKPQAIAMDYNNINGDGNFIYILNSDGSLVVGNLNQEQLGAWTKFVLAEGSVKDLLMKNNTLEIYIVRKDSKMTIETFNINSELDRQIIYTLQHHLPDAEDEEDYYFVLIDNFMVNTEMYFVNAEFNFFKDVYTDSNIVKFSPDDYEDDYVFPPILYGGFKIRQKLTTNNVNIEGLTDNISKRIAMAEITCDKDTKAKCLLNGSFLNATQERDSVKFKSYQTTSFAREVNLDLEFQGKVEVKNIIETINVGGQV